MNYTWSNTAVMGAGTKIAPLLHACQYDQRFSYYLYLPKGFHPKQKPVERLLTVIHGTFRDATNTRDFFIPFAEATNTAILAPVFPTGIGDTEDIHNYKFILHDGVRYDLVLQHMIAEVCEAFHIPTTHQLLYGFSGGGQFVHRYLYLHPESLAAVVVGSPGRITYLDEDEDWYAGIRNVPDLFGIDIDYKALQKPKILLFVGADDTNALDLSGDASDNTAAGKYGSNRVERLTALYQNYLDHDMQAELRILDGAAHEEAKVAPVAAEFFTQFLIATGDETDD